ncbi:initiation-control protein YabA [Atopococcus tabaci]|uniref:initiation-control protein YabA n=1 Tax=Atopococcus tabaci TaxID=269774 RepID=UPI0003FC14C7|nr:DNA replication initiation control protein YabA [Atopococcus tabaci]
MAAEEQQKKASLYDNFTQLEKDMETSLETIRQLKKEFENLMKDNTALLMENQHLRDRLSEMEKQQQDEKETVGPEMTRSRLNLEKIYEEGFHVCNLFYGSRRVEDEPCAFCLEVIYGERK